MDEEIKRENALTAVNEWFTSFNYKEGDPLPFKYKDSEEVMYKHGETIRDALIKPHKVTVSVNQWDDTAIQQARVGAFLWELTNGTIGVGEDPIGFLMSSYSAILQERNKLKVDVDKAYESGYTAGIHEYDH